MDSMLEEEFFFREYYGVLFYESDGEVLVRKIFLILLEKRDLNLIFLGWGWSGLEVLAVEWDFSYKDFGGKLVFFCLRSNVWL